MELWLVFGSYVRISKPGGSSSGQCVYNVSTKGQRGLLRPFLYHRYADRWILNPLGPKISC